MGMQPRKNIASARENSSLGTTSPARQMKTAQTVAGSIPSAQMTCAR